MHIESNINEKQIEECFSDFYRLQKENGLNIQITEFDMCLPESELFDKDGKVIVLDTREKEEKMKIIEKIIQDSGVQLEGITYWTATDTLAPDVERTNKKTFIAKDFYEKFKSLKEGTVGLGELLQHPFLRKDQVDKFREIYLQDGGEQILDEMIKSRQRDVISSRGSGLYSELTREKAEKQGLTLREVGEGTTQSFKRNPEKAQKAMISVEYGVKAQEEGPIKEEG